MNAAEDNHKDKSAKASGTAALITLVLVVAFAAATQYYLRGGMRSTIFQNNENSQNVQQLSGNREIFYEPGDRPSFAGTSSSIILCTRDGAKAQNVNGELLWNVHFPIQNNPVVKTAGKYVLIADEGGNDFALLEGGRIRWSKKLDNNIIGVNLNSNGEVTVLKEEQGYRGALAVYDVYGSERFTYLMANDFPAGSAITADGKYISASSIDTSGVKTNSNLTFLDKRGEVKGTIGRPGELIAGIGFMQNNTLVAIAGSAIYAYDHEGRLKWDKQYAEKPLYTVDINSGKNVFAASQAVNGNMLLEGSKSSIQAIDLFGHTIFEKEIDGEIKGLVSTKNYIAANLGKKLYIFNHKGKQVNTCTSAKDIRQVIFLEEENSFIMVTRDSLVQVKVK